MLNIKKSSVCKDIRKREFSEFITGYDKPYEDREQNNMYYSEAARLYRKKLDED